VRAREVVVEQPGSEVLVGRTDRVGQLVLNRPDAMNAITVGMCRALEAGVRDLSVLADVIVIRGAGSDFSVGIDVAELDRARRRGRAALTELFTAFRRALAAIAEAPVPVVAVVEGNAVAGGFELVLACDLTVVAEDARLADLHARFGQIPAGGSTQRLPRLLGPARALGMILTGDRISGQQAQEWGLVYRAVPTEYLEQAVADVIGRLTSGSRGALAASKYLVRTGMQVPLEDGLDLELEAVIDHLAAAPGEAAVGGPAPSHRPERRGSHRLDP
jgi:enoyl-CoA hydratase/carnithine racemase